MITAPRIVSVSIAPVYPACLHAPSGCQWEVMTRVQWEENGRTESATDTRTFPSKEHAEPFFLAQLAKKL